MNEIVSHLQAPHADGTLLPQAPPLQVSWLWWLTLIGVVLAIGTGDWLLAVTTPTPWVIWRLLYRVGEGAVLPLALTLQWGQVTAGQYYCALTGRQFVWMRNGDADSMVWFGLVSVVVLAVGLAWGRRIARRPTSSSTGTALEGLGIPALIVVYVSSLTLYQLLGYVAWRIPSLTQVVLTIAAAHYVILWLVVCRLATPKFRAVPILLIGAVEAARGLTAYLSGFQASLPIMLLAVTYGVGGLKRRHLPALGVFVLLMASLAFVWTASKGAIRTSMGATDEEGGQIERLQRLRSFTEQTLSDHQIGFMGTLDSLIDRIWSVRYGARAIDRVPRYVPHEGGRLMADAAGYVFMPRLFFPDKPHVRNPSDHVRKYSGIWVAGDERGTSMAFGYAAESYVDYGFPGMLIPILLFGMFLGVGYRLIERVLHDPWISNAVLTTVLWLSLMMFERSWPRMLHLAVSGLIVIAPLAFLVERWLASRRYEIIGEE